MKFKNVALKLVVVFVIGMMFNFNVEAKAATDTNYDKELRSVINKYGEENVIVGNGIYLQNGESKEIDNRLNKNSKWVSNNENIIKVKNNTLIAISEGTTFIVNKNKGKAYVEEVQVSAIELSQTLLSAKLPNTNRNYYKVFLDPGHGGADPGAFANGVREADINLIISEKVKQKLESKNVQIMVSRSSDDAVSLSDRVVMANGYGADTFVSIHQNSAIPEASGIETFYQKTKTQYIPYASKIQKALIANTGAKDRGIKPEDFYVLSKSKMPSALAECGFITNLNEANKLMTDSYQESIANAIADSIYNYLVENITLTP